MKKILLLPAFFLAVTMANSQQIQFGIKAGANFTKFTGDDAKFENISPKFKAGFLGGALANIQLSEMVSAQAEINYSQEGSKYENAGQKLIYKTDYINIPVLFQVNASGIYAETGPQIGFLVNAKAKSGDVSEDVKDSFKGINFSWGVGAGYKLSNGVGIGARYNFGLANIIDETDVNVKVSGFHIGLFYTLGK